MLEGLFYLMTSFWLGAVHAATPGHGKTIAASYIVGVRGRPVDALVLGIFVTLSHTSGIVLVAAGLWPIETGHFENAAAGRAGDRTEPHAVVWFDTRVPGMTAMSVASRCGLARPHPT